MWSYLSRKSCHLIDFRNRCFFGRLHKIRSHSPATDRVALVRLFTILTVQEMWCDIKSSLHCILDNGVPSKMTSTRFSQPWITRKVKRLSRQKKRSFDKARRTKKPKDFQRYKDLKNASRTACKEAYNDYVTNIISPESSTNPKRFWSFINSKKCDSTGVAPLKAANGITYSDNSTKANILNNQFRLCLTKVRTLQQSRTKDQALIQLWTTSPSILKESTSFLLALKCTRRQDQMKFPPDC